MKKIFTLALSLAFMSGISAQEINMTGPKFADNFGTEGIQPLGISADGSVAWGIDDIGTVAFYDFNKTDNPFSYIKYDGSVDFGLTVAGIPYGRSAIVSSYLTSFFYNLDDQTVTYIKSPDENMGLDVWDVSPDGKYVGCNLSTEEFLVTPMVGVLQEDGTYKFEYLDFDPNDAMGCKAQYTQVRHISDDGKYIMGIQPDNRGMAGRIVTWTLQDDGTYKFETPMDDFLYDFTCEKPGEAPDYHDWVTADYETDPDLYNQQMDEFDKVWDAFESKYMAFTKSSSLEVYGTLKGTRSPKLCLKYYDYTNGRDGIETPVFYDCETGSIKYYPFDNYAVAAENLPGGGEIVDNGEGLVAIDKDGNKSSFYKWLENKTNTNIEDLFQWTGSLPRFSADGKTLMMYGWGNNENDATAVVYNFDRDIFESVPTGIKVNIVNAVSMKYGRLTIGGNRNGKAQVFAINGTDYGTYDVNGTLDLNGKLTAGTYIVKVMAGNEKPAAFKLSIK